MTKLMAKIREANADWQAQVSSTRTMEVAVCGVRRVIVVRVWRIYNLQLIQHHFEMYVSALVPRFCDR